MYFMVINVRFRWAYDWVKKIVRRMMWLEKYSLHRQQNTFFSSPPKIMVRPLRLSMVPWCEPKNVKRA